MLWEMFVLSHSTMPQMSQVLRERAIGSAHKIGYIKSTRHSCTSKLAKRSKGKIRQLKCFLKIVATPPTPAHSPRGTNKKSFFFFFLHCL